MQYRKSPRDNISRRYMVLVDALAGASILDSSVTITIVLSLLAMPMPRSWLVAEKRLPLLPICLCLIHKGSGKDTGNECLQAH